MLRSEHAAPRLSEQVVTVNDAEGVEKVVQLLQEQVDGPEVAAPLGQVRRSPPAQLVVVDHGSTIVGQGGQREQVVMRATRSAVDHDERGPAQGEITGDAVPRLELAKRDDTFEDTGSSHGTTIRLGRNLTFALSPSPSVPRRRKGTTRRTATHQSRRG